jgi:hypothetical protein
MQWECIDVFHTRARILMFKICEWYKDNKIISHLLFLAITLPWILDLPNKVTNGTQKPES